MGRLEGKKAIVTGAGAGIGESISVFFAREGASVICIDLNGDTVKQTAAQINDAGGTAIAVEADVANEQTFVDAVEMAKTEFGGLTTLVSNAIYDLPYVPITEIPTEGWMRTMDVNLNATYFFCKHAIPVIADSGGGSIILVASQLGQVARPGRPWYCAQKGGMINLARALALDHAKQNIRVNSLSPGPVETGRYVKNFASAEEARQNNFTLMERLGSPDEIAPGAVFLASDESSFMTGSDLLIDGGYTAV
ncbi:MAG: glucose 1-dehydrogenase [Rhodospirillaceae bacterium]|jgi:NAD(P)-dependent dehydrogenase (short-subunit alcohol dehydrogenase family)|nr:glucose 1-dehydrogenase [Rhodospirillales bacterium]MBT3904126.1 glucose 1-dehydrogenase [Rhodospirillaceae bacterium]MBT4703373.1 glucose 1-dehydrogenase [Rhodospirillaceae bacterium]MBT5035474.1 glucose 1-dehydrogenase [Rhodospirillaceae bacterium]MBT6219328.1 glucose 1-dehydrogenase [Rhodospirillaceae bacterium]